MSNRFATVSLIVAVSILGAAFLSVIALFMFPGIVLFGVKYIGKGTHAAGPTTFDVRKQIANMNNGDGNFTGIILNTYEVPIEIHFTQGTKYELTYYENFNGITTSIDLDIPAVKINRGDKGEAVITTHEFHSFVYESTVSKRYLRLDIPLMYVEAAAGGNKWSLTINSEKSDVYFSKYDYYANDPREAKFYNLDITTNGKVSFSSRKMFDDRTDVVGTRVYAENYIYTTNNSIKIDSQKSQMPDAKNYKLTSKRGNITVIPYIAGNLDLTTNQGAIKLVSCDNLKATTEYGSIGYAGEKGERILVNGSVEINSKAGSIDIGAIHGTNCNITTSSGNVKLGAIKNAKIVTRRGSVEVNQANTLDIETNIGRVKVLEIRTSAKVSTMRGNIHLGTDERVVNNVTVFTRIGKVDIKSANGNVKIQTISSDVSFINNNSKNIDIDCGGKLKAKGLMGEVLIKTAKNSEIDFNNIAQGDTQITLGEKCQKLEINATNNKRNEVHYFIKGLNVEIYEYYNNQTHLQEHGSSLDNSAASAYKFNVQGSKASITVLFKSTESE